MQNLVIVESPTKARTLARYLGSDYQIEASMGHVRDLPRSDFGIDIEKNFEPQYVIPRDKLKMVNALKKEAAKAKTLWLATDPDREGEAIAWHISELLDNSEVTSNKKQVPNRVVFHEITEEAIKEAFKHPRDLDLKLVDAQQARRVLDRLVGYKLSPLLWKKVKRGLSAGRVQSVALRLIVEREREISTFKPVEYWVIEAELESNKAQVTSNKFVATVTEKDGKKLVISNEKEAKEHLGNLEKASYQVAKVTKKEVKRHPYPPFTTSTLQQAGANVLHFTAKKTMMLAQALYERGLITYMRTDSFNLSPAAISAARAYIQKSFGKEYLPTSPKYYKRVSKNAQEAHEAIRVTDVRLHGAEINGQGGLNKDHAKLYDLIWKRFVACQMSEAIMDQTTIDVSADKYLLRATGSIVKFDGWLKLYGRVRESTESTESDESEEKDKLLPDLSENENLNLIKLLPGQHFTEPPPRYTEASLIKKLEELGIGRPSTYAPILSTIQERFYVERVERKFIPTPLGFAVTDFVMKYFPEVIDYKFTALMEENLDEIARGERQWKPTLSEFYTPFEKKLETTEKVQHVKLEVEKVDKKCPQCGKDLIIRFGKFGKFLACSGFPDCKHTEAMEEKVVNVKCPEDGGDIVVRKTKRGKTFYGCKNWPSCKFASWTKPRVGTSGQATDSNKTMEDGE